jgi:hypothetical protein
MFGWRSGLVPESPSVRVRKLAPRLLVPVLLLGVWMMHGMSATTGAGCHGMRIMMSTTVSAVDARPMVAADTGASTTRTANTAGDAESARPASSHTGPGEMCLSGQPPAAGSFLLALLAALAVAGWVGFTALTRRPDPLRLGRGWRRGPPGLVGRELLTTVCVSRM